MTALEIRMGATPLEVREDGENYVFEGYASTFNQPYDMGWYDESVDPGAFKRTLGRSPDVRFLVNHGDLPLARTSSGTLQLDPDSTGLGVRAFMDRSDPDVQRLVPKVRRGDLNQMSFGFRIDGKDGQEWTMEGQRQKRTLRALDLHDGDVSIVTYPANPATSIGIRAVGFSLEPIIGRLIDMERRGTSKEDADLFLSQILGYVRGIDLVVDSAQAEIAAQLGIPNPDCDDMAQSPDSDEAARAALLVTERRIKQIRSLIGR